MWFAVFCFSLMLTASRPLAARADDAFDVTVNGASCTAEAPYYPIHTGRANSLRIRADFDAIPRKSLTLALVRTCPDGRTDQATGNLVPEQAEAVFDLGAFAVPAEYEYEHGVVYRRGYRFTLTAAEGGSSVAVFNFYQGPARAADSETLWKGDVERYVIDGLTAGSVKG